MKKASRQKEYSLLQMAKRPELALASDKTRHYSDERQGIEGKGPKSTKLIAGDTRYDEATDSVTFYFLTQATRKYDKDHVYKDIDPHTGFSFQRDPSETYEIHLRFLHVSKIADIKVPSAQAKSGATTKPLDLNVNAQNTTAPVAALPPAENEEDNVVTAKVRSASPEDGSEIPKSKTLQVKPQQTDNQSATKTDKQAFQKPPQGTQSVTNTKPNIPIGGGAGSINVAPPEDDEDEEALSDNDNPILKEAAPHITLQQVKEWMWTTDIQIWSNAPSFHWQGFNYNLSMLHASIYPTDIKPQVWDKIHGKALIDKHLLDMFQNIKFFINQMSGSFLRLYRSRTLHPQESVSMSNYIKWVPTRRELKATDGKTFSFNFEPNQGFMEDIFLKMKGDQSPLFENRNFPSIKERLAFLKETKSWRGYTVALKYQGAIPSIVMTEKVLSTFAQKVKPDYIILTNEKADTALAEKERLLQMPGYRKESFFSKDKYKNVVIFFRESFPLISSLKKMRESASHTAVITFGSFTPPTEAHKQLLMSVVSSAQKEHAEPFVFLLNKKADDKSASLVSSILKKLAPAINVEYGEDITTLYSVFLWLYNNGFKEVYVIVGNDILDDTNALLQTYDGKSTEEGIFKFDYYKVASFGKMHPDKTEFAQKARNSILDDDFDEFYDNSLKLFGKFDNELFRLFKQLFVTLKR